MPAVGLCQKICCSKLFPRALNEHPVVGFVLFLSLSLSEGQGGISALGVLVSNSFFPPPLLISAF